MSELNLQVKFSPVPESLWEQLSKLYSIKQEFYRGEPGGFFMNKSYALNGAEKIFHLKPREDDVWLVTFPKTGNRPIDNHQYLI